MVFQGKTANPTCYGETELAEYERLLTAPGGLRATLAFYRSLAESAQQHKDLAQHHRLRMPVLGLSADQGSIPDVAATFKWYGDNVHGDIIKACGHFQPQEQPEAVGHALVRFFQ
jgi:pimeloyl-ACP methyl ester carboxylesterase